jgi:hypothetical protein
MTRSRRAGRRTTAEDEFEAGRRQAQIDFKEEGLSLVAEMAAILEKGAPNLAGPDYIRGYLARTRAFKLANAEW